MVWRFGYFRKFYCKQCLNLYFNYFFNCQVKVFSIINNLLVKKVNVKKITFNHRLHIFFVQVIVSSPQMIISSMSNIVFLQAIDSMQILSSCLSIVSVIIISIIIYCNLLLSRPFIHQNSIRPCQNNNTILQKFNLFQSNDFFYFFLLHLLIPFFVVLKTKIIFFIFITIILGIRFISFYKKRDFFKGFEYFKLLSNQIGWLIYHTIFMCLWLLDKVNISNQSNNMWNQYADTCGNIIIFILIFVACVQILDFLYSFPSKYIQYQKNKIVYEQRTPEESRVSISRKSNMELTQSYAQKQLNTGIQLNILFNRSKPKKISHFKNNSPS